MIRWAPMLHLKSLFSWMISYFSIWFGGKFEDSLCTTIPNLPHWLSERTLFVHLCGMPWLYVQPYLEVGDATKSRKLRLRRVEFVVDGQAFQENLLAVMKCHDPLIEEAISQICKTTWMTDPAFPVEEDEDASKFEVHHTNRNHRLSRLTADVKTLISCTLTLSCMAFTMLKWGPWLDC
ncbi:hypothetical protein VNO77_22831 [Canavalia gladiata]|uniref:Uncharacterized protein n=1 Tax=Canavalia gladiata TaxID=3824 RepID=A0AAN9QBC1_CANGL